MLPVRNVKISNNLKRGLTVMFACATLNRTEQNRTEQNRTDKDNCAFLASDYH